MKLRVGAGAGVLAVIIYAGTLAPAAHAQTVDPLAGSTDQSSALALEARMADHLHYGLMWEQLYNTPARVAGDIETIEDPDDVALYTGNYLGAEAYRYGLAKREIAAKHDVAFWTGQRDEALARVTAMVHQYHILINISGSWQTKLDPKINTSESPTQDGYINIGGGVFEGQPGLLFRSCVPVKAPAAFDLAKQTTPTRFVDDLAWPPPLYPWVHASPGDATAYNCDGATSRDAYAGTTFGLATALDLVGPDDAALRSMIANDLITLTAFTFQYAWGTPRPTGQVVIPVVFGGNDLDGVYSPLFDYDPAAEMNLAQVALHASEVLGNTVQEVKWNAVWLSELTTQLPALTASLLQDVYQPHDSFYKFHLDYLNLFDLIRLEPNAVVRDQMREALAALDATTGQDVDGLFDALVYSLTGSPSRMAAAVSEEQGWLAYKARLETVSGDTDNSQDCGTPPAPGKIDCVPETQTQVVQPLPGGLPPLVTTLAGNGGSRSLTPLPVEDRPGTDFLWQKDPTNLDSNEPANWEPPGDDFLLPYWMLRYYSEAAPPTVDPLPAWLGPSFS